MYNDPDIQSAASSLGRSASGLSSSMDSSGVSGMSDAVRQALGNSVSTPIQSAGAGQSLTSFMQQELSQTATSFGGYSGSPVASQSSSSDSPVILLKQILDAIKALNPSGPGGAGGITRNDPSAIEAIKEALFGESTSTSGGAFAKRSRGIYGRMKSRLEPLADSMHQKGYDNRATRFFSSDAYKQSLSKTAALAKVGSGAGSAGVGGVAAAAGAGGAGGGAGGGVAAAGAAGAAGPVGVGVAAATILMTAAVEFGKAVYDFGRAQEQEARRLAQFGGEQAEGIAVLDAERTMRDIKTAEETGGSSKSMLESLNRLEEAFQPIESLMTNIYNVVSGGLMDAVSSTLELFDPIVTAANAVLKWLTSSKFEKEEKPETNWELLDRMTKEFEKVNSPKWPQGNIAQGPRGGTTGYNGPIG